MLPVVLGSRVYPHEIFKGVCDALHPYSPGLFIIVFDTASHMGNLVRGHSGITYENYFVVLGVRMNKIERRGGFCMTAKALAPHGVIQKVVKVKIFEMFEF